MESIMGKGPGRGLRVLFVSSWWRQAINDSALSDDLKKLKRMISEQEVKEWKRCKALQDLVAETTEYMGRILLHKHEAEDFKSRLSRAMQFDKDLFHDQFFPPLSLNISSYGWDYDPFEDVMKLLQLLKRRMLIMKLLDVLCAKKEDEHEEADSLLLDTEIWDLVLLESGDVESNPGPLTNDQLQEVVDSILGEDVYFQVFTSVYPLRANWHDLCLALGLPPSLLSSIRTDHAGDAKACLREGLINWLQRNYNTELHSLPSWRKLVEAVDHPAGGSNPVLASRIAEEHKKPDMLPQKQGSETSESDAFSTANQAIICADPKKGEAMSTAFANMYRAISSLLGRKVDVDELKDFLWCLCQPQAPHQRCIDPRVYGGATSTKDVLKSLCPEYINPIKLFVLEGIVETFGSRQCKRLLEVYMDKFY